MPELPEIETLCRDLRALGLPGRQINDVQVLWDRSIQSPPSRDFCRQIRGRRVLGVLRRGKYLSVALEGDLHLLIHFRMTGGLVFTAHPRSQDPHDRVVFTLDKGVLVFHDTRKFGRMVLTNDPDSIFHSLGPEPFDAELTPEVFYSLLKSRKKALKALLLDQGFIAGLGNIYTDESLFAAGLHPCTSSNLLDISAAERLLVCIREALGKGIQNRGTSLGDGESNFSSSGRYGRNAASLQVFRRTGKPCFHCGTPIERIIVAQRSTHFCPFCQPMMMKPPEHATL